MAGQEVFPGLSQPSGDLHLSVQTHDPPEAELMAFIGKIGSAASASGCVSSNEYSLHLCQTSSGRSCVGFFLGSQFSSISPHGFASVLCCF